NGVFQRRATIQYRLAMSSMAARLSAEMPSLNAATRSCRGPLVGFDGSIRRAMIRPLLGFLRERQRALVDFAARQPSRLRPFAHGVLGRSTGKGLAQQYVHITNAGPLRRRRPNDQHELAAQFARGHALGQGEEVAAADFLVQLGELAA